MSSELLLALALGYLLGSIPFGLVLTKLAGGGDLRKVGSGNIGATNVLRTGNKGLAALTLFLDAFKGGLAVWLAQNHLPLGYGSDQAAAAGALIGHLYPIWLRFRGGKGVATMCGILLVLWFTGGLIYAIVWIVLLLATRISSVAGIAAAVSAPIAALAFDVMTLFPILLGFAVLVVWKHRENILRLMKGTEPRIGSKASSTA